MGKTKKPASASAPPPPPSPSQSTSSSKIIKSACEQAIKDANSNPQKSLKKIKDLLSKHPNSAALHHTQSFLHFKRYSQTSDSSSALKLKYLKNATDSAKQALSLFPNSITLNYLYSEILIKLAKDSNEYQNIIVQCREAIKANPSATLGPGEDIVTSHLENRGKIQESRIQGVKELLLDIIEKAKVESLMSGKNVTEKMKESASLRILQSKKVRVWEDELFRKNQNLEREVIESKIELVRKWEQMLRTGVVLDNNKKIIAKIIADLSKKTKVLKCWKEMSSEERRGLLEVSIDEIANYYIKHDHYAAEIFLEAIDFARKTNKWKRLLCYVCEEMFLEWKELCSHVFLKHLRGLSEQQLELVLYGFEDRYVEEIENGVWKPVDVDNMVKELSRFNYCKNDVYQEKCKFYSDQKKWVFCDDAERQELLKKIHQLLKLFLKNQCLAPFIVSWMWDYTIEELEESLVVGFKGLVPILEQTPMPLCICFLWFEQLEVVFNFLEELFNDCGLEGNSSDDGRGSKEEFCDDRPIHFNSDTSCLILDKRFIRWDLDSGKHRNIVGDEGTAVISVIEDPGKDTEYDADSFVHWLFSGDEIQALLYSWRYLRNCDKEHAMAVFQFVETEFRQLKNLCERKSRLLEYQEALTAVKNICLEERKRTEEISEYKEQTFASLLLARQNELFDVQSDIIGNEHACILNVLRFAQDVGRKKFGLEETLINTYAQFPDLVYHEDKEKQDIMVDVCVEEAIKMEKQNIAREFCESDVLIMKSIASIRRMELKFMLVSALDYQLILFHLVKSFIRAHLEDLADEKVVEKANAAEALLALADLAPEPSKNLTKGSDNSRTVRKKSKHKKRKDQGMAMDEKANAAAMLLEMADLAPEPSKNMTKGSGTEDLKQQEEEH
ncbi:unnamed protein product [Dovyalis caffra]|uniref:C2H2-type domain-containing protein n=1 Tax=Dovyalis caffra TaxID=77055 RepID=A0AAV1RS51_9ROSI|nr:unnamed protein product [Dovyalis caffra]